MPLRIAPSQAGASQRLVIWPLHKMARRKEQIPLLAALTDFVSVGVLR
jgi:hypothetical protein